MSQTAEQRLARAQELARQARDSGQISREMYDRFVQETGGSSGDTTPVLINAEVQLPAGRQLPAGAALNDAVYNALQSAARNMGATIVRDSVRVVVGR